MTNGEVQLVFNTTEGQAALADSKSIRRAALMGKIPYYTTLSGAVAAAQGIVSSCWMARRTRSPATAPMCSGSMAAWSDRRSSWCFTSPVSAPSV
jgi:hypothetical protein